MWFWWVRRFFVCWFKSVNFIKSSQNENHHLMLIESHKSLKSTWSFNPLLKSSSNSSGVWSFILQILVWEIAQFSEKTKALRHWGVIKTRIEWILWVCEKIFELSTSLKSVNEKFMMFTRDSTESRKSAKCDDLRWASSVDCVKIQVYLWKSQKKSGSRSKAKEIR